MAILKDKRGYGWRGSSDHLAFYVNCKIILLMGQ